MFKKYGHNLDSQTCNYIFTMFYELLYILRYVSYTYHILSNFRIIVLLYTIGYILYLIDV